MAISRKTELMNKLAFQKLNHTQISISIFVETFNYVQTSKQFNKRRKAVADFCYTHIQTF